MLISKDLFKIVTHYARFGMHTERQHEFWGAITGRYYGLKPRTKAERWFNYVYKP